MGKRVCVTFGGQQQYSITRWEQLCGMCFFFWWWTICRSVMQTFVLWRDHVRRWCVWCWLQYPDVTCNAMFNVNVEVWGWGYICNAGGQKDFLKVTPHCRRPPRWNRTPCWWAPRLAGSYRNRHSWYCRPGVSPWQPWFEQCSLSDYRRRWSPICGACGLHVAFSLAFVGPGGGKESMCFRTKRGTVFNVKVRG